VIARLMGDRRTQSVIRRIDRPEAVLLATLMAAVAAAGWLLSSFWLAVAIAAELAIGGLGAVAVIGPARIGLGYARYTSLAMAGVAMTLFGRLLPVGSAILFTPLVAVVLWITIYLELRLTRGPGSRTLLDLLLTGILFAGSAGIFHLFGTFSWPPPLALVALLALVLALRGGEARGSTGVQAVGQALLHVLAVAQLGIAVTLLVLPGVVGPAIIALAFYVWGGAADALQNGSSSRSVVIEFGSLALLGLLVALLLHAS
jgi:hypothetical protein